jgi:hypothetical protein
MLVLGKTRAVDECALAPTRERARYRLAEPWQVRRAVYARDMAAFVTEDSSPVGTSAAGGP